MMPKLNGIKFVEHLHSLQPRIRIIFITGFLSRYFKQDNIGRRGRSSCEAF
jgi:two-component SAPR family response regulator